MTSRNYRLKLRKGMQSILFWLQCASLWLMASRNYRLKSRKGMQSVLFCLQCASLWLMTSKNYRLKLCNGMQSGFCFKSASLWGVVHEYGTAFDNPVNGYPHS